MRQMATIQKILDIQPIEGADAIDVATINSWKVVVKKGEFSVGQLVIYFEIDSFIPTTLAPFLTKSGHYPKVYNEVEGERLRTIKLRGQVSQGLILPCLSAPYSASIISKNEGDDVSEELGVVKYDPPLSANLAGVARGNFPSSVPKTDEERVQNLTRRWPTLRDLSYEVTEKMEGCSMTVGIVDDEFVVCSRNLSLKDTEGNTLWEVARKYNIEDQMRAAEMKNLVFQGECVGEGIQGNYYDLTGHDFYVFRIFDVDLQTYLPTSVRQEICTLMKLKHVPILPQIVMSGWEVDEVLMAADGPSVINPAKAREGLVFKEIDGQEHWKAVSNKYLLRADSRTA